MLDMVKFGSALRGLHHEACSSIISSQVQFHG